MKVDRRSVVLRALALSLGTAVALGLARFAYALLLPAMKADLGWSYALAGGMNAANAAGYLVGALAAAPVMARVGTRRSFVGALLLTALSMLFSGAPSGYLSLSALRVLSGAGGAVVFISGGVLASHLAASGAGSGSRPSAGTVLALYFGGGGLGIFASGVGVPALLTFGPEGAWRWAWAALGVASLLALLPATRTALRLEESSGRAGETGNWSALPLAPTFLSYFLFALGYIAYMTFAVALLTQRGANTVETSVFWSVLGISAVASAFLWGTPIERLRSNLALASVLAVVTVGAILPLLSGWVVLAFASAVLFGGSFLAVPTTVTAIARRSLPPHAWSTAISALTVVFAAGQCFGPVISGALSDAADGLVIGLALSASVLAVATLVALLQRSVRPTDSGVDASGNAGSTPGADGTESHGRCAVTRDGRRKY